MTSFATPTHVLISEPRVTHAKSKRFDPESLYPHHYHCLFMAFHLTRVEYSYCTFPQAEVAHMYAQAPDHYFDAQSAAQQLRHSFTESHPWVIQHPLSARSPQ